MRISDWSSDVCSSDLLGLDARRLGIVRRRPSASQEARHRDDARRFAMRSGLIASLSIAVAAVAGLVIGDDALPVALADKANGAIPSDGTRPTLAGNPVRDYLSSEIGRA